MGIGLVNYSINASWGAYNQKLTNETKNKLSELGIQYDANISENEGKKLIQQYQETKKQEANQNSKGESLFSGNQQNNDAFQKAIKLAEKLGINTSKSIDFQSLMNLIEERIKSQINANKTNESALVELKRLSSEFESLQMETQGNREQKGANQILMESLEALSLYNKNFLNKN